MNRSSRIAVAALLAALAVPALAADPAQDCTVCRDPMWPTLVQPMPGIPLDQPAEAAGPTGIQTNATRHTVASRSNGIGVAASAVARGSVYADPLWPQAQAAAGGMGAPAAATPARAPKAAPVVAPGTVATR
jgi:hypothetical protein